MSLYRSLYSVCSQTVTGMCYLSKFVAAPAPAHEHSTAQHSTAQHSTARHGTAQNGTARISSEQQRPAQDHTGIYTSLQHHDYPILHVVQ